MIGKFEVCQASYEHGVAMAHFNQLLADWQIDEDALAGLLNAMMEYRSPESQEASAEENYRGGFLDGFIVGIKAQYAESFVVCQSCGKSVFRQPDPVPGDFDPKVHVFTCYECVVARQASMN